jgi:hypothetical protein
VLTGAVVQAGRLEQSTVLRVEQNWQFVYSWQIAGYIRVCPAECDYKYSCQCPQSCQAGEHKPMPAALPACSRHGVEIPAAFNQQDFFKAAQ